MTIPLPDPVEPAQDMNRYNPHPHWRLYRHPAKGPVAVCVQDFDYRDYDGEFLGYAAYPDEASAKAVIDAAPKPPPKVIEFTEYLHGSDNWFELAEHIATQTGVTIPEALMEKIGRPFYEVSLRCSLDMETGAVTLIEAKL